MADTPCSRVEDSEIHPSPIGRHGAPERTHVLRPGNTASPSGGPVPRTHQEAGWWGGKSRRSSDLGLNPALLFSAVQPQTGEVPCDPQLLILSNGGGTVPSRCLTTSLNPSKAQRRCPSALLCTSESGTESGNLLTWHKTWSVRLGGRRFQSSSGLQSSLEPGQSSAALVAV